jgi:DNA-binding transcriptional ArsR family regulator
MAVSVTSSTPGPASSVGNRTAAGDTGDTDLQRYAAVGHALADPKRLCVLEQLSRGERSVSELSRDVGCQVPNMSQHLAVLRSAGLVVARREGSTVYYRLTDERVLEAYRLIKEVAR